VKILLDENLPRKLVAALRAEGHEVESVHTLRKQGMDNGGLLRFAVANFDICFTRDFGFAHNVRQGSTLEGFKLLRVILAQKPQDEFVAAFISAFRAFDPTHFQHGDDWP
jgi:predicted nuclease of predicted toxin-antitoxin system